MVWSRDYHDECVSDPPFGPVECWLPRHSPDQHVLCGRLCYGQRRTIGALQWLGVFDLASFLERGHPIFHLLLIPYVFYVARSALTFEQSTRCLDSDRELALEESIDTVKVLEAHAWK